MQEKQLGQKFVVHATLYCDFSEAAKSDALKDTVNYAAVYRHLLTLPASRRIRSCAMQMQANARVLKCIHHVGLTAAALSDTSHMSWACRCKEASLG